MILASLAFATAQVTLPVQPPVDLRRQASHLDAADLNGDGVLDLTSLLDPRPGTGQRPGLRVVLSTGPGAYGNPDLLPWTSNLILTDQLLADFDGDGAVDVIALAVDGNTQRGSLYAWRNSGDGTFQAPLLLTDGGAALRGVVGFTAGDLQGDGFTDVMLAVDDGTSIRVDWLAGPSSFGSAAAPLLPGVGGSGPIPVLHLADLDDDGSADLAIGLATSAQWARGDGLGGLTVVPGGAVVAPYPVKGIEAVDQNGDGHTDLAFATELIEIILIPDPFWEPTLSGPSEPPLVEVLQTSLETCVALGGPQGPAGPCVTLIDRDAQLIDVNDDGHPDLVYLTDNRFDQFTVAESLGGGAYGPGLPQLSQVGFGEPIAKLFGVDLDLDGSTEVLVAESSGTVDIAAHAAGSQVPDLRRVGSVNSGVDADGRASIVDVDGDGRPDVAVEGSDLNRVVSFRRRDDGSFEPGRTTVDELQDRAETFGTWIDLGSDGVQEFVCGVFGVFSADARVFEGDGAGGFSPGVLIQRPNGSVDLDRLFSMDMDGDGDDDLAFLDEARGTFGWYEQGATGGLSFKASSSPGPLFSYDFPTIALGDFNGDGWVDVVSNATRNGSAGREAILTAHLATPGGGFASPLLLGTYDRFGPTANVNGLFAVDVNGDGSLDIVRAGSASGSSPFISTVEAFLFEGAGGFGAASTILVSDTWPRAFLDFDGDSLPDVLGQSLPTASGGTSLFLFRGANGGFLNPERIASDPDEQLNVATGDVDNDGDIDLVVLRTESNQIDLVELKFLGDIGLPYCSDAVPNSTGLVGELSAFGSARVQDGDIELRASSLPPAVFGLMFTGTMPVSVPLANSIGTLCVGGQIGRFVQPGQILGSGMSGTITLAVDPRALPLGAGFVSAAPGETRFFQLWHRDLSTTGVPTSNLTAAVRVLMH